jgi:putative phosphoesterase
LIAVVADTHLPRGGRRLPSTCVTLLASADLILHAGDVTREAFLDELESLAPVVAVHGNVDEAALHERLPASRIVETEGLRIGMIHDAGPAAGRHERLLARFPSCDAVVYGHTHVPEVASVRGAWILNPGSPTERRRGPYRAIIVVRDGVPALVPLED